ncbi:MAG: valine--tRNA ligase, partial [Candidatus Limnocylindrales bacterium]
ARARPLTLTSDVVTLPRAAGGLEIVPPIERFGATVVTPDAGGGGEVDRARLEKELGEAQGHLAVARARLANEAFTGKAPPGVVAGARTREAELADQVARLRERLGR